MGLLFWKKEENLSLGKLGEKAAAKFLKQKGYKILETNFFNPRGKKLGEIDIIARKNGEIIFVEVKTRLSNGKNILPEENITFKKLYHLNKIARFYIRSKNFWQFPYHFDAVSVWMSPDLKSAKIKHLENIFI